MNEKTFQAGKKAYIVVSEGRIIPTRTLIKKCTIIATDKQTGQSVVMLDGTEIEFFVNTRNLFRSKKSAYARLVEYLRDTENQNR